MEISDKTLKFLLNMQQNEINEHHVYLNLVKFVKKYLLNIWFLVSYNQLKRCNNLWE